MKFAQTTGQENGQTNDGFTPLHTVQTRGANVGGERTAPQGGAT